MAWEDSYERHERLMKRVMITFLVLIGLYLVLSVIQVAVSLKANEP